MKLGSYNSAEEAARVFDKAACQAGHLCVNFPRAGSNEVQALKVVQERTQLLAGGVLLQCALVLALSAGCYSQPSPPPDIVITVAGSLSGTSGLTNGVGTLATFNSPVGVTADAAGNIYVADQANHAVRKITPSGVVTTLSGGNGPGYTNGAAGTAKFYNPSSVAVDASGNVYVCDSANSAIRKVSPTGTASTLAGSSTGQTGF